MDDFASLPTAEKRTYIEQAALRTGLAPEVLEKDFWVVWLLGKLFSLETISPSILFKGGTSLSKAYGLIHRFSEDIDISIDRSLLGFDGERDPLTAQTNTEANRRLGALQAACADYVKGPLMAALTESVAKILSAGWALELDQRDPLTILFSFPSVLSKKVFRYITPYVKLEFGARADLWPQERKRIRSCLADVFPGVTNEHLGLEIQTLGVARTYWEKATILHAEFHRPETKEFPTRLSRHHYDLFMLSSSDHGEMFASDSSLLEQVVRHKEIFFRSSWANYQDARPGSLKLVPPAHQVVSLAEDYALMRQMFFSEPPSLNEILNKLQEVETRFNQTKG